MSKNEEAIANAKPQQSVTATITLDTPIKRGEQLIEQLQLRKPATGELRGVALADLLRLDVAALHVVLPRITSPALTTHDVGQLDLADLVNIGGEIAGFFMTKAEKAALSPAA